MGPCYRTVIFTNQFSTYEKCLQFCKNKTHRVTFFIYLIFNFQHLELSKLRVPDVHEIIIFSCFGDVSLCVIWHSTDCGFCLRKSIQLHSSRPKEKSAVRRRGVCLLENHRESLVCCKEQALPTASLPPRIEVGRAGDRPEFGRWRGCVRGRGGQIKDRPLDSSRPEDPWACWHMLSTSP